MAVVPFDIEMPPPPDTIGSSFLRSTLAMLLRTTRLVRVPTPTFDNATPPPIPLPSIVLLSTAILVTVTIATLSNDTPAPDIISRSRFSSRLDVTTRLDGASSSRPTLLPSTTHAPDRVSPPPPSQCRPPPRSVALFHRTRDFLSEQEDISVASDRKIPPPCSAVLDSRSVPHNDSVLSPRQATPPPRTA